MKVSTKVQYGMLALTDIALYSENGSAVSGPEIAERQDISQKYLEQILGLQIRSDYRKSSMHWITVSWKKRIRQGSRMDEACAKP